MMKKLILSKQIYLILAFVLLLALLIQTTRMALSLGGELNKWSLPDNTSITNALTEDELARLDEEQLLVLYDPEDAFSLKLKDNTVKMLGYMKKKHQAISADEFGGHATGYDGVIVALSNLGRLPADEWMDGYVLQGGRILLAASPQINGEFYNVYRKLGINDVGSYIVSKGLQLHTNILMNYEGEGFSDELIENASLQVELNDANVVHLTANDGLPLLWETTYGKGKFIVFNGTILQEKTSRGLLSGAIALLKDDYIYPVMNMKLMYIDDFPAPMPTGFNSEIFEEYKRSTGRFFKEVWWPDMIRIASKTNMKYTGAVIQSYDDKVTPPFATPTKSDNVNLVTFGNEILKQGGEIAIHGYNHQSLTTASAVSAEFGYHSWSLNGGMEESIRNVLSYVQSTFPNYTVHNYVPPSNVLGIDGREALKNAWPGLKSISSVYSEDAAGLSYVQEFEIAEDGIIEMPRITSGFLKDEFNDWAMANAATSIGVFSHFVHPDDILDHDRSSPYTWEELYGMFETFINKSVEKYGWLNNSTATEAGQSLRRYASSEPHFVHKPNRIEGYVNSYTGGALYYYLRTDKKITKEEHCKVRRIDENSYLVEVHNERFVIGLGE